MTQVVPFTQLPAAANDPLAAPANLKKVSSLLWFLLSSCNLFASFLCLSFSSFRSFHLCFLVFSLGNSSSKHDTSGTSSFSCYVSVSGHCVLFQRIRTKEGFEEYPLCIEAADMDQFGVGVMLYFRFLKKSAWFFLLLTILCLPTLLFAIYGNPFAATSFGVEATTIGHLGISEFSEKE